MKKICASLLLLALVVAGVAFAVRQSTTDKPDNDSLSVVASYYPVYEFAKQIGGSKVHVTNITPAGAEPHDYEPSAKTLADAQKAAVFIYNGGTMEHWTAAFLEDYEHTAIRASKGIDLSQADSHGHDAENREVEGGRDPHFWLDPVLAQTIVTNIKDGFSKADPANAVYYSERATAYNAKLAQLDQDFRTALHTCTLDTIIASHGAFSYVAKRYGFTMESIAALSPENEPSAARLAELSDHITEEGIKYVFFERLASPQLAATIAEETGAQTLVLDPIEGLTNDDQKQGKNYVSAQRENLANLRTALACE